MLFGILVLALSYGIVQFKFSSFFILNTLFYDPDLPPLYLRKLTFD